MISKKIEKIYAEPVLNTGGVSFNSNDTMVASGNAHGDIIVRNL